MSEPKDDTDQLWNELRAMRLENHTEHFAIIKEITAIRSKTDKLEARAGIVGGLIALVVSVLAGFLTFFRRGG
jgi:hypothetical protein